MPNDPSNARELLCTFTFSDGRRCKMPSYFTEPDLCYFHALKFQKQVKAERAGNQIAKFLNTDFVTACDLSNTFATLFCATAQGYIKPKTAATLAYLGQLMLQTHIHAKQEFQEAFDEDSWQNAILKSFPDDDDATDSADTPPAINSDANPDAGTGSLSENTPSSSAPAHIATNKAKSTATGNT